MGRRSYRDVFFAHNGPGPYVCFECGEPVDFDNVTVHHRDHDHGNNDPGNLVASHGPCHMVHHARERIGIKRGPNTTHDYVITDEHRAKLSAAATGRVLDSDVRRRIADAKRGQSPSAATRAKLSDAARGRQLTNEHRERIAEAQRRSWATRARGSGEEGLE